MDIKKAQDGSFPTLTLATGQRHTVVVKRPPLELERLYHDDHPVQNAELTVELSNGKTIKGKLDASGKATIKVPGIPVRVQFGPDERDWERVDKEQNPDYQEEIPDIDAFINQRLDSE